CKKQALLPGELKHPRPVRNLQFHGSDVLPAVTKGEGVLARLAELVSLGPGLLLATACDDGLGRLFQLPVATGDNKPLQKVTHVWGWRGLGPAPFAPLVVSGGREVLSLYSSREIAWTDIATGQELCRLKCPVGNGDVIHSIAVSPSRRYIAV